jgi:ABC-type uncharacterized transport system fused permease/ATPase subunit
MNSLARNPITILVVSFFMMWLSAQIGIFFRKSQQTLEAAEQQDRDVIVAATLTLLGLIIGFTFSMAVSRYDQRKLYEEAEANAIGTEYVRADLLSATDAARVRTLLKDYLDQRILFYQTTDERALHQINTRTAQLQTELWSTVRTSGAAQPTPIFALAVSGMNDVLNSQGYTQAAWRNRIPTAAWALMVVMAICCNMLTGYGAHRAKGGPIRRVVLPLVLCIAFFLIADIDSPRKGIIHVVPQNLTSLSESLQGQ